jgi:hypothetical protein
VEGSGVIIDRQKAETMRESKKESSEAVKKAIKSGLAKEVSKEGNQGGSRWVNPRCKEGGNEKEDDDQVDDICPKLIDWRSA